MNSENLNIPQIAGVCVSRETLLRARVDALAKPPGALGRMEDLAVRLGAIDAKALDRALLLIFAGDHGLTEDGVSSYPSSVTGLMVETFLAGRASANAFARTVGADVRVVQLGLLRLALVPIAVVRDHGVDDIEHRRSRAKGGLD